MDAQMKKLVKTAKEQGWLIEKTENNHVITSYSIHYTKLYDQFQRGQTGGGVTV